MVFAATTLSNVKQIIKVDAGNTTLDATLTDLIGAVSLRAENYIGRSFEQTERTEVYDIGRRTRMIQVRNWPIDTAQTFEIRNDIAGTFTGALMTSTLYRVKPSTGRIYFIGTLIAGPDVLQLKYTGGVAVNAAAIQGIEDLEYAIRRQVAHEFMRRNSPGAKKPIGSRTGVELTGEGEVNLLATTREVLNSYRGHFVSARGLI